MAIRGNLAELSFVNILQLLLQGRRIGVLRVNDGAGSTSYVYIKCGQITYAREEFTGKDIVAFLQEEGAISKADVEACRQQRNDDLIAEALLWDRLVNNEALVVTLTRRVKDILFYIMSLRQGEFEFLISDLAEIGNIIIPINVNEVLFQSASREDRWVEARRNIPNMSMIFEFIPSKFAELTRSGMKLSWKEWNVISLLDGKRSVSEVVRRMMEVDPINVVEIISSFMEKGLVRQTTEAAHTQPAPITTSKPVPERVPYHPPSKGLLTRLIDRIKRL